MGGSLAFRNLHPRPLTAFATNSRYGRRDARTLDTPIRQIVLRRPGRLPVRVPALLLPSLPRARRRPRCLGPPDALPRAPGGVPRVSPGPSDLPLRDEPEVTRAEGRVTEEAKGTAYRPRLTTAPAERT